MGKKKLSQAKQKEVNEKADAFKKTLGSNRPVKKD